MTDQRLLVAGHSPGELREKFRHAPLHLRRMWDHFLLLARNNPFWFSNYNVLAYVVTGEHIYAENIRHHLLNFIAAKDDAFLTREVQFHTHTSSAPLGRLMLVYDWIADSDLLSPDEHHAFRDAVLEFANLSAMQQLQGRARRFDNQIFSNAFAAAITGYVLGIHRDNRPLAHRLYLVGMEWLIDQFSRLPHSCYSGEGSTYHQLVVAPLLTLAGAFLDETTTHDVYGNGIPPSGSPLRDWLRADLMMIGPGGLVPGWDAYGTFRTPVKTPLVYLAMRDADPEPLAVILDNDLWYPMAHGAWEFDDRLWTLAWWPSALPVEDTTLYRPWMNSRTAGALQCGESASRFFQYWDECPGAPHCGRPNVNPNAIQFDYSGLPLLLDGAPGLPAHLLDVNMGELRNYLSDDMLHGLRRYRGMPDSDETLNSLALAAVAGSIGESNSLVFNHENWYVPLHEVSGVGLALHRAGPLQVVASDSTAYYRDRYNVTAVKRVSAMLDGETVLCVDDVKADSPCAVTWQAFTWPDAELSSSGVTAIAGRDVRLDLASVDGAGTWRLTSVNGFARNPGAATRLELDIEGRHTELRVPVLLTAQLCSKPVMDLSTGWDLDVAGATATDVDLNAFYLTDSATTGTELRFNRTVVLAEAVCDGDLLLRIQTASPAILVTVNGLKLEPAWRQDPMSLDGAGTSFPLIFDLTGHVWPGSNQVTLTACHFHGESIRGPVTLLKPKSTEAPVLVAHSSTCFEIMRGDGSSQVLVGSEGMSDWAGGETDACHGLQRPDGVLCLAGVTTARFPRKHLDLTTNLPIDISFSGRNLEVEQPSVGTEAIIRYEDLFIYVRVAGAMHICHSAMRPAALRIHLSRPLRVLANRQDLGVRGGPGDRDIEITIADEGHDCQRRIETASDVYRLAEKPTHNMPDLLLNALDSADWRVQMAAADLAGNFRIQACVPALLRLLEAECRRPQPRWLTHSWRMSKMNIALGPDADHSPDTDADPVEDVKRYRLARAVITALGKLGAGEAIPLLENELSKGTLFFLALSQVPVALARLDSSGSVPLLEDNRQYGEVNVRDHVELALDLLTGRIDRQGFEAAVNPA